MAGIYLHIPYCKSRCIYCDFYSTTLSDKEAYVESLCMEMRHRRNEIPSRVHSIYIGGGTPSTLSPQQLHRIFTSLADTFDIAPDAEVTIEANPDDVTPEWVADLHPTPVNRISMGVQTFDDDILHLLGRRHTSQQAREAVRLCHDGGYDNLSLDLIYGLPRQTFDIWQHDVEQLLSLGTRHISAYALSYESGTRLERMLEQGLIEETDEELSLRMYRHLCQETRQHGFEHYEISNFALPGYHSRHNSSYWQSLPYLGLGAGAHSFDGHLTRRANLPDVTAYISAQGDAPHETELLSPEEATDELIMTRLRTARGLRLTELSLPHRDALMRQAHPHIAAGRLTIQEDTLRLTEEGIFVSNDIISDLMML